MNRRPPSDLPIVPFASDRLWEKWLKTSHGKSPGVWLKIAKAGTRIDSVTYAQALETALCYGWIDGRKEALDAAFWLQRFTPRKSGSRWSKINRGKAERLIDEGRMKPAGMKVIDEARKNGAWKKAYASQAAAMVPEDLQSRLDGDPAARAFFESMSRVNRYAILYRIQDAKKPETRARRVEKFMAMLQEQRTIYPG